MTTVILLLDEAVASKTVFVIVTWSDERADGRKRFWSQLNNSKQGHHHNGDQAARQPHILCSICFQAFEALAKAVRLFKA